MYFELDEQHSIALAEFVKRENRNDQRACAVNDDKAWLMKNAFDKPQQAQIEEGYSPR